MPHRPSEQHGKVNRPREVSCEHERGRLRRQREKAAFYKRNPHLKWNERG